MALNKKIGVVWKRIQRAQNAILKLKLMQEELITERKFSFEDTTATKKIFALTKRIRAVKGGTSASKTISILIWLIDYSQSVRSKLSSVVSESYPHLEKGAMLDFENIMKDRGYWKDNRWNSSKHTYHFETGSNLEFFSPDTYGKAHGPRRDNLFANECINLEYKIIDQLMVRTREVVWLDWNPSSEFWFDTELMANRPQDIDLLTLTYKDNEALDASTVYEIESHRNNKHWWPVYGLGQLGTVEGRIYKDWQVIEAVPFEARLERRGLDFGYSNDPAALVDVYRYNGGFLLDEQLYRKGYLNKPLADFIMNLNDPDTLVVADCAEPKSIDEIKLYGVVALPAIKGKDSIRTGIQFVQQQKIWVTARSVNLLKEYRAYLWMTDPKSGALMKEAEKGQDHCMDALRYALMSILAPGAYQQQATVTYHDV